MAAKQQRGNSGKSYTFLTSPQTEIVQELEKNIKYED